ncbi:MAG TPA: serine/threonine-protein kinase, partial [Polyangiaceae bacterium]|nr:serine/threonine-protein kinase [Polyangiaceae bacterium]
MSPKSREELELAETQIAAPGGDDPLDELLRQAAHVSHTERTSQRTLAVGTRLVGGRFSILRRLGEGGMGIVYEAFDDQRKGRVALKTLTHIDAAGVYRLKNEFRALSDVIHPNLVQLYELFAENDAWFFSMELIDGERFDRWVRPDGAVHEQRLRRALPQLVAGVAAIHTAAKLHRDLKPSNVLVTPEGRVVVLDFGLSVDPELGGVGHTLADASISGTPAYMAPEQAAGKTASAASDYYAIGVMLFEALTGR